VNVLVLTKFPPIQGGVSAKGHATAWQLASLGHRVDVITNASACEPGLSMSLDAADRSLLEGEVGTGCVAVHDVGHEDRRSYIPWAEPFVTKLVGRALAQSADNPCDVIYGSYLEPYGVAAAVVATITNRPLVIRHAGSDVGRLARNPDLAATYRWVLGRCDRILTRGTGSAGDALRRLGADPARFFSPRADRLPRSFRRGVAPLDISSWANQPDWFAQLALPEHLTRRVIQAAAEPLPPGPVVGIYGKTGVTKGTFDLLTALEALAAKGLPFSFAAVAGGRSRALSSFYSEVLASPHLASRTRFLPLMAPWRIPSFVAACDVVAMLERDFGIPFHNSRVLREVLAVGRCLVCSEEIAGKQWFAASLVDGANCVAVADPRDTEILGRRLAGVLEDTARRRAIAARGRTLSTAIEEALPSDFDAAGEIARFAERHRRD
jgi:glycosyltransferase involved in cell wall biosynthesis